jgi:hypothetical protein
MFKILQYSEIECNCVMKITEGLFRKYSTLWQHKCESPIRVLKLVYTLAGGPLNCEAQGFSLSSRPFLITLRYSLTFICTTFQVSLGCTTLISIYYITFYFEELHHYSYPCIASFGKLKKITHKTLQMDNPENWQIDVREYRRVIKNGQSRELANKR